MQEEEQKPPIKIPIPYKPVKYFVSSLNTKLGCAIVQRLRNDLQHPDNPHRIVGTLSSKESNIPLSSAIRKVIDCKKVNFYEEVLLDSDVIIYDLNTCDLQEAEFMISTLKINDFKGEKVLICISNVMTWAKSKPLEKKEGDDEDGDDIPAEQPDTEEEGVNGGEEEGQEKKVYVRFTDKNYTLRKPAAEYENIKSIETLCLAAGKVKNNLKSYMVCSGILYGAGQQILSSYFLKARLQKPIALPYFGNGKNRIPMIHLEDLVTYIIKIIEKKPQLPYIIAIDHNPKPTQKKIIEAISKGIGTGKVCSEPISNEIENIDKLTLNIRMKPTMYFIKLEEQQAAQDNQQGQQAAKFKFPWCCREGIQKCVEQLRQQYNKAHNLHQQKILVVGPPGCGKTYYSQKISQKYYLPHIHIKKVIEQVMEQQSQFAEEVKNFINEKKQTQIQQKQTEYEEKKEKYKKIPKQFRQTLEPFDAEKVDVRLSDELVYKCFQWRINQNDCLNRGYVMDGYPRRYQDAKQVFMNVPALSEGEQQNEQNQKKILDVRLSPDIFIILEMSDEQILKKLQQLPQQQIQNTHYVEKQAKRRLKKYRILMNADTGQYIIQDFFKEYKINIYHVNISINTDSIIQSIIKPLDLVEKVEHQNVRKLAQLEKKQNLQKRNQMESKQKIVRDIQHEDYIMKKQNQQNEERQILDKKSLVLRKYLDANLVSILSEGIVSILKNFPEDPVDNLAQFLFKESLKVLNPNPCNFQY